jgi:hypothetical protein
MVYILKGKVSWLRLLAIIWTASSDAARQACGKAAARCRGKMLKLTRTVTESLMMPGCGHHDG